MVKGSCGRSYHISRDMFVHFKDDAPGQELSDSGNEKSVSAEMKSPQYAVDLTPRARMSEPVDLTGRTVADERKPGGMKHSKSVLKNIDTCISLKFYGGASSNSSSVLDTEMVAAEQVKIKRKKKKRKRDKMFTRFIPYSENNSPLPCNMSIKLQDESPPEARGKDHPFSVLTPRNLGGVGNVSSPGGAPKVEPVSPLPRAPPVYSLASSYFPNLFPFEITSPPLSQLVRSSPQDVFNSAHSEFVDVDTTEPYTRAALGVPSVEERSDRSFYPHHNWQYGQGNAYRPYAASSGTDVRRRSVSMNSAELGSSIQDDVTEKYGNKDVPTTSSGSRAYKMKQPVKCRHCDRTFWSHTGRYYHEAIHTGKWLFQCKFCDAGFMQRKAYDSHMRAKHKPRAVETTVVQESFADKGEGDRRESMQ